MDEKITVLIVDDEEAGREALAGVLFSQGYKLLFADNGPAAYQMALESIPDLALLDVMMPQMTGFELCRLLRQDPVLAEMPIIMVTALDDRSSRLKGIEAGADDFLSKPFDRIELRARVRTITRLNRFRRLLQERTRLFWAIDQATEGYTMLNQQGLITYANDLARAWLSLPVEGNPQVPCWEWVSQLYNCEPGYAWSELARSETPNSPLYLIHPEDEFSSPLWLKVEVFHFPDGTGQSALVRMTEITQRLHLEQYVSGFHARVNHKLRTPTANIRMAAEILRRQLPASCLNGSKVLLDTIVDSATRLELEVKDILSYIQVYDSPGGGEPAALADVPDLVKEICRETSIQAYTYDQEESLAACSIKLTRPSLEVVLREVLENSRKFHPANAPRIAVQVRRAGESMIRLTVQDDGVRVSPEKLQHVWLPYYQGEKAFTGEVPGMGLGLSTVAFLVWEAGGQCQMKNRVDEPGVIVELQIPLANSGEG